MRTPFIGVMLLASSVANAAPINFVCDGKTTVVMQGQRDRVVKEVRTLAVDLSAKTVTFEGEDLVPIWKVDEEAVNFATKDPSRFVRGVLVGSINQISGSMFVRSVTIADERQLFEGICKRTQKMF